MWLSDFDYVLPKGLIAQEPLKRRDASRLLVVDRQTQKISHRTFRDFPEYLKPSDALILNNTRVIPVRLLGYKKATGGKVDALLVRRISDRSFEVWIRPSLKTGQEVIFNNSGLRAYLVNKDRLEFSSPVSLATLRKVGFMPLPPYIKRLPQESDNRRYQTVYAKEPGAIAAPTAGLHFTKTILEEIKRQGTKVNYITLHVGPGTFKPVKCEDIRKHVMEPEEFVVPGQTSKLIRITKEKRNRVFAVGTTTVRALEAADMIYGCRHGSEKRSNTGLFIYPGYRFKVVDCLLTNFHLPKTTLFMLVCALAGRGLIMRSYQEAIRQKYRFYSYGDAMLIL